MFNEMKNYTSISKIIHKEGYIFVFSSFALTVLFSMISSTLAVMLLGVTLLLVYFFRDPMRFVPQHDDFIISPADGIIQSITESTPPAELGIINTMRKISIFLSPLDVHVNRSPASGEITAFHYHSGQFLNASLDKASELNERCSFGLKLKNSDNTIYCTQIAGLVARRIVNNLSVSEQIKAGERFGIIKFSSRVDLYLPLDFEITIKTGQSCIGGETIIGLSKSHLLKDGNSVVPCFTSVERI